MKASKALKQDDLRRVEVAIGHAEEHTTAEIVCAVASESGRYDRAESLVGLICAIIALSLAHLIHDQIIVPANEWTAGPLRLVWQVVAVSVGFIIGHLIGSYWYGLRRLFVSEREMAAEVSEAGWHVFGMASIAGTTGRSGVLVYISLFERRVLVLADGNASAALGDEALAMLRDRAVGFLRDKQVAEACIAVVQEAGVVLAERLPGQREIESEQLANHVLVFHPRPGSLSLPS